MLFNSLEFLIFLPVVFCLYWFVFRPLRWQNLLVVVASYVFYGWWNWRFLILIAITTGCSYAAGVLIDRFRAEAERGKGSAALRKAKAVNVANILLNLGILGAYKYYDFFATQLCELLGINPSGVVLGLILPVGLSFYTFQALSYSIDVYRGKLRATRDLIEFAAYISFFPQLVAGPIERATNLLPQFQRSRTFRYEQAADGMRQMLWGLFKKLVVADNCATFANFVFDGYQDKGSMMLLLGGVAFAFQIYGDFSGYSDIAIGTAKLFGITLKRNFNVPYFSRDIAEFWRRWHISLNTWFVDYLYIPLGGSREGQWKKVRNTFAIFLTSGLWHGANWTFIVWGAYHAVLFLPLILLKQNRKYLDVVAADRWYPTWREAGQMAWTFVLVVIGWIIFRAESISQAWDYLLHLATDVTSYYPLGQHITVFGYIALLLAVEWWSRREEHALARVPIPWRWLRLSCYAAFFIWMVVQRGNQATFIYFQF